MKKIILSQEQELLIIQLYNNNLSLNHISELMKISRPVITRILKENNVSLRQKTHKYQANYDIFENIDTAEKAYWLGFLAADGCNYLRENNASIIIAIHQKDKEHLNKFKQFCSTDAIIKDFILDWGYSNKTPMSKIVLNSKKMSNDLIDKGIVPNKSLILSKPNIQEKFYLPFILGYFDGDGSIFKTTLYNNYSISIEGTYELLTWINSILNFSNKLEQRTENNKNNYYIRCGGTNKPYMILCQLYNSCNMHLDRKYNIYKSLEAVVLNRNIK